MNATAVRQALVEGDVLFLPIGIPDAAVVHHNGHAVVLRRPQHITPGFHVIRRDETGAWLENVLPFLHPIRA